MKNAELPLIEIVKTDAIKAKFARMPIETLSLRFLVEVLEPVRLVPRIIEVSYITAMKEGEEDSLKAILLAEWLGQFEGHKRAMKKAGQEWVYTVSKVDLIECDLLTPKV